MNNYKYKLSHVLHKSRGLCKKSNPIIIFKYPFSDFNFTHDDSPSLGACVKFHAGFNQGTRDFSCRVCLAANNRYSSVR